MSLKFDRWDGLFFIVAAVLGALTIHFHLLPELVTYAGWFLAGILWETFRQKRGDRN